MPKFTDFDSQLHTMSTHVRRPAKKTKIKITRYLIIMFIVNKWCLELDTIFLVSMKSNYRKRGRDEFNEILKESKDGPDTRGYLLNTLVIFIVPSTSISMK